MNKSRSVKVIERRTKKKKLTITLFKRDSTNGQKTLQTMQTLEKNKRTFYNINIKYEK